MIVLLNGPPRCGKDMAGRILAERLPDCRVDKFARFLKERTHRAYGLVAAHDAFEYFKDESRPEFLGRTPREAYIAFSEALMKSLHGKAVFGTLLADEVIRDPSWGHLVITDSGFVEESEALLSRFSTGLAILIRIHREGCSFFKDSRSYIDLSHLGVRCYDVVNPGDLDGFAQKLYRVLENQE